MTKHIPPIIPRQTGQNTKTRHLHIPIQGEKTDKNPKKPLLLTGAPIKSHMIKMCKIR